MMPEAAWLGWVAAAYLAGAIPCGLLIGRSRGVDVRQHGSGNIGATNVGRVLGRRWGILCFVLDVAKGLTPVLLYALIARPGDEAGALAAMRWLAVAVAAVVGHVFPVWLGFRGGKGVATGLGVVLGMWPVLTLPAALAGAIWFVVARLTGYVSVASMAAAASLPPLAAVSGLYHRLAPGETAVYTALTALLGGLVIYRHRSNIAKLRAGAEPKVAWAKPGR